MHIVQLANFYGPTSGGLRVVVDRLRRGYVEAGIEATTIVPGAADQTSESGGGRILTVRSPVLPGSGGTYRIITRLGAVRRLLDDLGPDRIEISDKTTLIAATDWASERAVPSVLVSHERLDAILAPRVPSGFPLRHFADWWNRRLAARFDTIVCASSFAEREFLRVGAANLARVPLGVDLGTFRPRPVGRCDDGYLELVTVGRISTEKRVDLAIDALRTLIGWGIRARLTVVGDGPDLPALRARAIGVPVAFTGHIADRNALAATLARADVAIAPCPAETFGLAALEALACGTPVVVTQHSGAADLVTPTAGRAVPAGPRAIARAVRELAELPRAAREIAARSRAEEFPWSATIDRMLRIHQPAKVRAA